MTPVHAPSVAPSWSTRLALTAAVLGVHVALLLGPVPWASAGAPTAPTTSSPPQPNERSADAASLTTAVSPSTALVSTVRWIVPAPALQTTIASVPPSPRPFSAPQPATPKPKPRAIAPEPTAEQEPPRRPIELDPTPLTQDLPSKTAARDAPNTAEDDEMLAAAAVQTREPATTAAVTNAPPPAQPPGSTRLDYAVTGRIKGIAYSAEGQLDWMLADGRYSARMEMRVFLLGSRVQTSTGQVGPSGLMPERFSDKSRSEKAAHFDSAQNLIRFSNNAPDAVLLVGAQDRLSLFLQIAALLQANPQAYASGQTIEMQVAGTGDADIWRFEVGDEVMLSLPAGEIRARQLKRLPRKEFDSTVEMWLAPDLQHLPVRLRVTQANGDVADQQLMRMP